MEVVTTNGGTMALPKGVDLLPSGKFRARFMYGGRKYSEVWDTPRQAEDWIRRTRSDLARGIHPDTEATDPRTGRPAAPLFADYAAGWVANRDLKPSTRTRYAGMVADHLAPAFGKRRVDRITPDMVAAWHRTLLPGRPTMRAHCYALLRAIMNSAVAEDLLPANPCRVKGAGQAKRATRTDLPTVEQVAALVEAMPGPKYKTMTLVAAWSGLRFGELVELRRKDLALDAAGQPVAVKVRRAYYLGVVDTPKSAAGIRDVAIPPHIRADLADYLASIPKSPDRLLFPGTRNGTHMAPSSLYKPFYRARAAVGLPALRWHDLRHFSATTAAGTGATLAELQARLGHSTVAAAMRYQHAASGRDADIAAAMSNVVKMKPRRKPRTA
jgi:integrase